MNFTAYTPTEAALWAEGVQIQDALGGFLGGFLGWVLVLGVAFALFQYAKALIEGDETFSITHPFVVKIIIMAVGAGFFTVRAGDFGPTSSSGMPWKSVGKLKSVQQYLPIFDSTTGLYFYKLIHGAAVEVSTEATKFVTEKLNTPWEKSPEGAFRALAMASRSQFDDPELVELMLYLDNNCAKSLSQPIVDIKTGLSAFWNLDDFACKQRYQMLRHQLDRWAAKHTSVIDESRGVFCTLKFDALCDSDAMKNIYLANAAKNYIFSTYDTTMGLKTDALAIRKSGEGNDDRYFSNAANSLAWSRLVSFKTLMSTLMGRDYDTMAAYEYRNDVAEKYNDYLRWLPAVRGYLLAFCAVMFLPSVLFMCFGRLSAFLSWCTMTMMLSLYPFFSALAFCVTARFMDLTRASELGANRMQDPTMIGMAAWLTEEVSWVQTTYFGCQIAIMLLCSVGVFQQILGFTNKSDLLVRGAGKVMNVASAIPGIGMGARAAAAAASRGARM